MTRNLITVSALFFCLVINAAGRNPNAKVDAYIQEKMKAKNIPGLSLAIAHDGKVIYAKGYGKANLELGAAATEKTVYHIASITKTFTAVAVMKLVEEGKISLDDPISKHVSDLPDAWRSINLRQLLNHTSGIKSFSSYDEIPCPVEKSERDYALADVLKEVACLPLDFAPGTRWAYGDTGYHLLGMTIEKVSGKNYEQFLRERIFAPSGMTDTRRNKFAEIVPNRADGYAFKDGKFSNAVPLPDFEFANGGLLSTVLDMAKFDAALMSGKLLKKQTLEEMWTNARLNDGTIVPSYGLGFGLTPYKDRRRVGHSGGGGIGFAAAYTHFPAEKITVIVLSNADQEGFTISEMANEIAAFYF